MHIQINAGSTQGRDDLAAHIEAEVSDALNRFSDRITRVAVYLHDENGDKGGGGDKRCVMEARLRGRQPVAVTHHAATPEQATRGAAGKLNVLVASIVGRLRIR